MTDSDKKRKLDDMICDDDKLIARFKKKRVVKESSWEKIISDMVYDLEESTGVYLNCENILEDIQNSIISNNEGIMNKCTLCGRDMGRSNPRQLCGKIKCDYFEVNIM